MPILDTTKRLFRPIFYGGNIYRIIGADIATIISNRHNTINQQVSSQERVYYFFMEKNSKRHRGIFQYLR